MPEPPDRKDHPHPWHRRRRQLLTEGASQTAARSSQAGYAELQAMSNFSFLRGASHADELMRTAAALGLRALAIADRHTLAGIVRAHVAAKEHGVPLIVGARIDLSYEPTTKSRKHENTNLKLVLDGPDPTSSSRRGDFATPWYSLLLLPTDLAAYGRLCRLLTVGKRRAAKGECELTLADVCDHHEGLLAVIVPPRRIDGHLQETVGRLRETFDDDRLSIAASRAFGEDDAGRLHAVAELCRTADVPMVATNDVCYHGPDRRALHDVLTCVRHGCTLDEAGLRLNPNAERHLKGPDEMARLFVDYPEAIARTVHLADRCAGFDLDQLRYQYPHEVCPPGKSAMAHLTELTWNGARQRYGAARLSGPHQQALPNKVRTQLQHELNLIAELDLPEYFLTVYDIVQYARSRGILCQGRGAAANSAVCYCLGVTSVDPARIDVLFERFVSKARNEPPDIDIDFEHERREEVIQYIYDKYGRDRAALTAEVITYRGRSAIRDVGKALGLSLDCVDRLAKQLDWWDAGSIDPRRLRELGYDPADPTMRQLTVLVGQVLGFPRHLSQHVGGFVITDGPLCELVPIENAAMDNRTVIEWDKDDIEAMGMMKVDCLGLGMLTCLNRCFGLLNEYYAACRDGETKRRRDEVEGTTHFHKEQVDGECKDVPGSGGMAKGHGVDRDDLSSHTGDAEGGAVRSDESDATVGVFDSVQYRRRVRAGESSGSAEVSSRRSGIVERTANAIRTGDTSEDADARDADCRTAKRDRSCASGTHPVAREQTRRKLKTTSSLRLSVSSSLPRCLPGALDCLDMSSIPPEDEATYDMICNADTVGVFQIESRAQMTMLPRLRPRCYYDLVIEVAIVRPGPIVGDMVHPYLKRRNGEEAVTFPDEKVRKVLGRTLGVPLFQEQAMALAIEAAGFTAEEADQLRRAIAAWKSKTKVIFEFGRRIVDGMVARGYHRAFAERCFEQMKGFSEYGFPESHAASFALIVYASAWLKCHHPAAFAAALINSQPMGFYAPAQIVRDAKEHGVEVRPIDVNHSEWDCSLEQPLAPGSAGVRLPGPAMRLGMRLVKGLRKDDAERIAAAVGDRGPFDIIDALWRASGVSVAALRRLASADAFGSMGLDRQNAVWQIRALKDERLPMFEQTVRHRSPSDAPPATLPPVGASRQVVHDYASTGLSLKRHPATFLRSRLDRMGATPNGQLKDENRWPHGRAISVAGLVLVRQRPGTASGVVFMTLEDETGVANLIFRPSVFERFRRTARHATMLLIRGRVERKGQVVHVMVRQAIDLTDDLAGLRDNSRNFR